MALIHCIYASAAALDFSPEMLHDVLTVSRRRNQAHDISGMLLYTNGSFFQVLEGPSEHVDALVIKLQHDRRHADVTVIIREAIYARAFAEWTMGYASPSAEDVATVVGANDFFAHGTCFRGLSDGRAKKLLRAFQTGRWRSQSASTSPRDINQTASLR